MKKFISKPILDNEPIAPKKTAANESDGSNLYLNSLPLMDKPKNNLLRYFIVILLAILFGFGSSFIYIYFFAIEPKTIEGTQVIIDKQEEITVTSEERLREILLELNQVVVGFYEENNESDNFYQKKRLLGNGLIVTTDGWIATSKIVFDKFAAKSLLVLTQTYQKYEIKEIISDPLTDIVFLKIEANNLPVAKFGSMDNLVPGQLLYALSADYPTPVLEAVHLKKIKQNTLNGVVASTEKLTSFLASQEFFDADFYGAPLISLSGEIIAIINNNNLAVPLTDLKTAISDLGKKDKIERALFGVHYISLADYPIMSGAEALDRGALLAAENNLTAIKKNSPADKAGLRLGDIITFVEDELVNGQKNLTEIIQSYEPGDKLRITYMREGKEMTTEVELGKLE